ncbi:MAG: hypothetical protein R2856_26570 [Caldilineaceae bacterium]
MNMLLSRLDEQQRRWYVAVEAERIGHGGTELLSKITGINVNTIRARGREELSASSQDGQVTECAILEADANR